MKLATSAGDIVIELDAAKAPKSVDNFLAYVKSGHYDGTVFHRVIENFMVQGGGMTAETDLLLRAPTTLTPVVQQVYMVAGHILCALVERALFPKHP